MGVCTSVPLHYTLSVFGDKLQQTESPWYGTGPRVEQLVFPWPEAAPFN